MLHVSQIEDAWAQSLQKGSKIADEQMAVVELEEYKKNADPSDFLRSKKPASESSFESAGETKPVHLHSEDPIALDSK